MEHLPLPDGADYDDLEMAATFPGGGEDLTGVRRLRFDVETNFISVMPHQYRGIRQQLDREPVDAVLAETAFSGVLRLLMERTKEQVLDFSLVTRKACPHHVPPIAIDRHPAAGAGVAAFAIGTARLQHGPGA